ncbi:hypothetical protein RUM43_013947 [Polyplax serrata]|uniref:Uncharacterized protein n=1 Tax=Polyplax serrata TaxID=468196 RepID=A0AAN8NVM8_POLSC
MLGREGFSGTWMLLICAQVSYLVNKRQVLTFVDLELWTPLAGSCCEVEGIRLDNQGRVGFSVLRSGGRRIGLVIKYSRQVFAITVLIGLKDRSTAKRQSEDELKSTACLMLMKSFDGIELEGGPLEKSPKGKFYDLENVFPSLASWG